MTSEQTAALAQRIAPAPDVPMVGDEVAERTAALMQQFSKDQMVEAWFTLTGGRGDTARTSKGDYAAKLARFGDQAQVDSALLTAQGAGRVASPAVATPMLGEAGAQLAALIQQLAGSSVNEAKVREIVADAVKDVAPRALTIIRPDAPAVTLPADELRHAVFDKALKLVAAGVNVMLKGPAACGKTHLAEQMARALGRNYGTLHCTAGASEAQLLGYLLPSGASGAFEFHPAQFATMYETGNSLFLLDEGDNGDANMLGILNGALSNGHLHIPQSLGKPVFKRGEHVGIMMACNTFGTGADAVYVGRNALDAATLSRFYVLEMDYDRNLERALAGKHLGLLEWVWQVREKADALKLRRVVSTRMIQFGRAAIEAGLPLAEVKRDLLAGWTRDEISKTGAL